MIERTLKAPFEILPLIESGAAQEIKMAASGPSPTGGTIYKVESAVIGEKPVDTSVLRDLWQEGKISLVSDQGLQGCHFIRGNPRGRVA